MSITTQSPFTAAGHVSQAQLDSAAALGRVARSPFVEGYTPDPEPTPNVNVHTPESMERPDIAAAAAEERERIAQIAAQQITPDDPDLGDVPRPPKVGAGSGTEAWAEYAQSIGIPVTPEMKRADIIAAIEATDTPSADETGAPE